MTNKEKEVKQLKKRIEKLKEEIESLRKSSECRDFDKEKFIEKDKEWNIKCRKDI